MRHEVSSSSQRNQPELDGTETAMHEIRVGLQRGNTSQRDGLSSRSTTICGRMSTPRLPPRPLHKIQPLENQLTPNAQQPCIQLSTIPYQRVLHSGEPGQKCWDKIKSKLCECKVMSSNATKRRQCCTPCSHSGSPATGIGRTLHGHQNAGIKLSQNFVGIGARPKCQDKIKSKLSRAK